MEPYMAMIFLFGGNFTIRNFAMCWGGILPISVNTALFSLLGTTYGGNGQTTFALPDLRGRVPVGWGQGPGLPNYDLGQTGGTPSLIIGLNNMPIHNHVATSSLTVTPSASTAAGTTNIPGPALVPAKLPVIGGGPSASVIKGYAPQDATTTLAPVPVSGTITTGMTGGSAPFDSMNPYLVLNYQIATSGLFPPRD